MKKCLYAQIAIAMLVLSVFTQRVDKTEVEILNQMERLREAHLKSDPLIANELFDVGLILTSQSGKLYPKKDALANIKNKFGFYENSEIKILHLSKKVVIVNYINERQIADFPRSKYRVTAVWIKRKKRWKIVSIQSSKIINRKR